MKKTISVNIKGINFLIEEDAYELLQNYIDRLTSVLKNEQGSNEIIEDVELRIAELCTSKLSDSKTVIEYQDIESILSTLGSPEDFVDEDEGASNDNQQQSTNNKNQSERRLFRDKENATIAGVCSGIANYFSIDIVIIRAIFVLMFIFAGFGLPLYIILWVIIPPAKNTIDKLRMKGRPITVETVREEVEGAAGKIKKESRNLVDKISHNSAYKNSISRGGRFISSILGIGFIGVSILILAPFIIFFIGDFQFIPVQGENGFLSFEEFGTLVLSNDSDYSIIWYGSLIAAFSIILFFLLLGFTFIFKIRNKWSRMSLIGLFLICVTGVIMSISSGVKTGRDFVIGAEIERPISKVFIEELTVLPKLEKLQANSNYSVKSNGKLGLLEVGPKDLTLYGVRFEYKLSPDSLFHITESLTARSHSHKKGLIKCRNIEHSISLVNDTLYVSPNYTFPKEDKLRAQQIKVIIEIPANKKVKFNSREISLEKREYDDGTFRMIEERGHLEGDGDYRHY